ncbi:LacI family DNA-binding transcriptional regulator [Devosia limi]|uniref:Transcriptional regulator, LacI family n=1 Tax=Devosia limi DSM 17137 TaxID=1121477 RepID=A0A1M4VVE5_9HYPH|nr:LacI family DNA-binding transcriptional regulator [Devosia limi]SHE72981.1 transcriptional regulator, LacI family [Devosia limi DSM 17137]
MRSDLTAHSHDNVLRLASPTPLAGRAKPVRIEEVAARAGVSAITVSRALRKPELVSPKTRDLILKVVEETGYWSNPHASALRSGRSSIVAAFVSNFLSHQFGLAVRACTHVLEGHGYQVMVGQTAYSYSRELTAIQSLRALRPAAVFFTGVIELEDNRQMLRDLNIPIVESWANPPDPLDMLVGFSNTDAGRLAASHLAGQGYRRLAFVGRSGGRGALRLAGFRQRAAELGLQVAEPVLIDWVDGVDDGRTAYRTLMQQSPDVEAVFCANDLLGVGMLTEARRAGRQIPDELGILSFGDNDVSGDLSPNLSTISVDSELIGRRAGELILDRLNGNAAGAVSECLDIHLTCRQSTARGVADIQAGR